MSAKEVAKSEKLDMLNGPLAVKLLLFALPLAASSILQQLFNAADVAVVGKFAGGDALAAVGANSPVVGLFINAFVGIAVGTNVVLAQRIGRGEVKQIGKVVHTSIKFAIYSGVVLMLVGLVAAVQLLKVIGTPEEVLGQASLYLRIYFIGVPFAVVYNFGAAILRSVGDTKRPMICLVISGVINLVLNLFFVIVLKMGVAGVGIATSISNIVSALMVWRMLTGEESYIRLDPRELAIDRDTLVAVIKMGGPAAIQSMVFSVSNICLQAAINGFGTNAIAGSAAALNFEMFDFLMINSFNQAAVTFIGQNYAAGKHDRCKRIYLLCIAESMIGVLCMMGTFYFGRDFWVSLYTSDPAVMEYALVRMKIVMVPQFVAIIFEVTGSMLRGQGKSMTPAMITMIGSVGLRILWLLTVFRVWHTYESVMAVYPVSWIATDLMMVATALVISKRERRERGDVC